MVERLEKPKLGSCETSGFEFCCMQESYDIVGQLLFGDFLGLASHLRAEASSVRGFPAAQRERPRHV